MLRLTLFTVLCVISTFVSKAQTQGAQGSSFVKFSNNNRLEIHADAEITRDKPFAIRIPSKRYVYKTIIGGDFKYIFKYKTGEEIVLLYAPNYNRDTSKNDNEFLNISQNEFKKLMKNHCLDEEIKVLSKLSTGKRFGVRTIRKENFYVLYLNVKSKDAEAFNYSIKSLELQ